MLKRAELAFQLLGKRSDLADKSFELTQVTAGCVLYKLVAVFLRVLQSNRYHHSKVLEIIEEVLSVGHCDALQGTSGTLESITSHKAILRDQACGEARPERFGLVSCDFLGHVWQQLLVVGFHLRK